MVIGSKCHIVTTLHILKHIELCNNEVGVYMYNNSNDDLVAGRFDDRGDFGGRRDFEFRDEFDRRFDFDGRHERERREEFDRRHDFDRSFPFWWIFFG